MSISRVLRVGAAVAALSLLGLTSACADESAPAMDTPPTDTTTEPVASDEPAPADEGDTPTEGDGEYAFGSDRDMMAEAIDAAFASENGSASWEGDTLVLSVDGDATESMAGFTQCRVLVQLLTEDDVSVVAFPNGRVACADVLPD